MTRLVSTKYLNYFIDRGVPSGVALGNFPQNYIELLKRINFEIESKSITISPQIQEKHIKKGLLRLNRPFLTFITGQDHAETANQLALLTAVNAIDKDASKSFYWHQVTSGTHDSLRDNEDELAQVKQTSLLIMSGVAVNSTTMKIEKIRDLIEMFSGIPRIVIGSGMDPLHLAYRMLYVKPNYVMYFSGRKD